MENLLASDEPNFSELEEFLALLDKKRIDLKDEDCAIENLIDDMSELEKEVKISLEYYDKITHWKFRITKKLKENKMVINPVVYVDNNTGNNNANSTEKPNGVKFPHTEN